MFVSLLYYLVAQPQLSQRYTEPLVTFIYMYSLEPLFPVPILSIHLCLPFNLLYTLDIRDLPTKKCLNVSVLGDVSLHVDDLNKTDYHHDSLKSQMFGFLVFRWLL